MDRISSPGWYSHTSEKAIPFPLKAVWYSPANIWLESPLVFISILRTFFKSAEVLKLITVFSYYLLVAVYWLAAKQFIV